MSRVETPRQAFTMQRANLFAKNTARSRAQTHEVIDQQALSDVLDASRRGGGIYLGQAQSRWLFSGEGRSAMVLGPTRSGKTTSIIIPNLLGHAGPVVSTSTKSELVSLTAEARSTIGNCMVFDPTGMAELPPNAARIGWSPLSGCQDWDIAMANALAMTKAAGQRAMTNDHWSERAGALLSTLLHAAAIEEVGIRTFVQWVDRAQAGDASRILATNTCSTPQAEALLDGILQIHDREQSGIWSTASSVLRAYRSEQALQSAEGTLFDASAFLEESNSLYLCGSSAQQELLAPLFVGLLSSLRDAAYTASNAQLGFDPVLFALDEIANIAPFPDLPNLISEGGGQGVLTLACLQDLSQARRRWGPEADGFVSLFPVTMLLPGIADRTTLTLVHDLAGEQLELHASRTEPSRGFPRRASTTLSGMHRPVQPMNVIAKGLEGHALMIGPTRDVMPIELTPSHRSKPWSKLRSLDRSRSDRSRF